MHEPMDGPVYLDYNATTPVDPRVTEAMLPYLTAWFGNPSSSPPYAERPRRTLADARAQVTALIGAHAPQMVFTASGSEANLLAVHGAVLAAGRPRPHVITQSAEHPAVTELVVDALQAAAHTRGGRLDGAVFHSDNGAQYRAREFTRACRRLGVTRSRGAVGTGAGNAVAESFNATLKRETLRGAPGWPDARTARLVVFRWITGSPATTRSDGTPASAGSARSPTRRQQMA